MSAFEIHPRLVADCHVLGRYAHCHLLLNRNATLPWFILVPETDLPDLLDLPAGQRAGVLDECAAVARFVKEGLGWPRINFGAIGNLVPQMHLHVIGRRPGDACWPAPVWGHLVETGTYDAAELVDLSGRLTRATGLEAA